MKARPILFSGAMVRALLAGTKTQTRRELKLPGWIHVDAGFRTYRKDDPMIRFDRGMPYGMSALSGIYEPITCPYGAVGDLIYVREAGHLWSSGQHPNWIASAVIYKADNEGLGPLDGCRLGMELRPPVQWEGTSKSTWTPGIHMPRWASRLTLRLIDVRVERLQEISEADALAEGIKSWPHEDGLAYGFDGGAPHGYATPTGAYRALWESINGKGSAAKNEWVWVLEFSCIKKNVDEVLHG